VKIGVSIGAAFLPLHRELFEDTFVKADADVYDTKRIGKN
jgi:predicted signal transduction protein with EAL and GGDEF domain